MMSPSESRVFSSRGKSRRVWQAQTLMSASVRTVYDTR